TGDRGLARRITKLPGPPYVTAGPFQQRARLLADLGTIEFGKTFGVLVRELLVNLVRAYGIAGAVRALRNINVVLSRLLSQTGSLDPSADPPRVTVPVHFVFGERDVVTAPSVPDRLPAAIGAPASTVVRVPNAGHMAHFDRPDVIRSIAALASRDVVVAT